MMDSPEKLPDHCNVCSKDRFLVDWQHPIEDNYTNIVDPRTWTPNRKQFTVMTVSCYAFLASISSSIIAPALITIGDEFDIKSQVLRSFTLSIYYVGFVIGALPYGPLSEVFGRTTTLNVSTALYVVFNLASGFAQNTGQLLAFRLLSGIGGSACISIGAGVVSDCYAPHELGKGSSFYGLAPRLGPALGPLAGGFITQYLGWRWNFHITSIIGGLAVVAGLLVMKETRDSVLLKRKAQAIRKATGSDQWHTRLWPPAKGQAKLVALSLLRPVMMLICNPICQYLSVYQLYSTGILYLVLSTYSELFTNRYDESLGISGLNYISIGLGLVLGNLFCGQVNDQIFAWFQKRRNTKEVVPEFRVPLMIPGAILLPVGLILYGWTAEAHVYWIAPNIGVAILSAGIIMATQAVRCYTIDAFGTYAASATGATNLLRAIGGFAFPLFAPIARERLGYGMMGTVLAVISVVLGWSGVIILWYFGANLRRRSSYEPEKIIHG